MVGCSKTYLLVRTPSKKRRRIGGLVGVRTFGLIDQDLLSSESVRNFHPRFQPLLKDTFEIFASRSF
jgi:hypothetical protein